MNYEYLCFPPPLTLQRIGLPPVRLDYWESQQGDRAKLIAEWFASVDTLPKGQDAKLGLAGTEGSAVTPKAGDAQ